MELVQTCCYSYGAINFWRSICSWPSDCSALSLTHCSHCTKSPTVLSAVA